jgi:predicted component of type VI protein secretion system
MPFHEGYLWGNPAWLCGHLLASAFQAEGWELEIGEPGDIEELPVHKFEHEGEKQVKPCAEAWLSDRAGERIRSKGLIPVLSIKHRDAVRVLTLQGLSGAGLRVG